MLAKNTGSDIARWKRDAEAVKSTLDTLEKQHPGVPIQLWKYEPNAAFQDGTRMERFCRTAFSIGDLDTAKYVAIIVPGTTHSVNGQVLTDVNWEYGKIEGPYDIAAKGTLKELALKNAIPLYEECRELNSQKKFAVVLWMGYRAPMAALRGPAVWAFATDGAPKLISDVLEFRKHNNTARLIISGHSYGSTTVGVAAKAFPAYPKPPELVSQKYLADSIVLLGSPGCCAMKAKELGDEKQVFVCSDYYDIITYLAAFGRDPAATTFGAVTLKSKVPGTAFKKSSWPTYALRWCARRLFGGPTSHSHYYDPKNPSLKSIARITVQEEPEKVTKCQGRSLLGSWESKQFNWAIPLAAYRHIGMSPDMWATSSEVVKSAVMASLQSELRPLDDKDPNEEAPKNS
ncbi:alpha/beta hydrolase [Streptomyces sp. NPDC059003]|uniref:alpha/beta hydrolase n=1 Tax=Streptomyces sp. NPDC059003 TaxID=3346691 RepID=UPI0036D1394B